MSELKKLRGRGGQRLAVKGNGLVREEAGCGRGMDGGRGEPVRSGGERQRDSR